MNLSINVEVTKKKTGVLVAKNRDIMCKLKKLFSTRFYKLLLTIAISAIFPTFVNSNPQDPHVIRDGVIQVPTNDTSTNQINSIQITGLRVETSEKSVSYTKKTVPEFIEQTKASLRLFGYGFTKDMVITFASWTCQETIGPEFPILANELSEFSALVHIVVPFASEQDYRICVKNEDKILIEQESSDWLLIRSNTVLIPLWLTLLLLAILLVLSALFSGLNLGLMALDKTELKILRNTGNEKEREYAKVIQPVREHGNFLLCSILLGNVLVNSTNAILMGTITSGLIAVIVTTLLIVIFGEVTPQAICSRHGLAAGAKTIFFTKFFMFVTSPLSYPISKVLDYILGEEIGNVYNRERLKELVRVTTDGNDLDKDEVNIISGALDMKKKTVSEVMTHIDDVFMLSYDAILDFETISEIMKSGYSRIPVYDGSRHNVQKLLLIKDLALIDPDDNTPLRTLCEFYQNYCYFVFEDVTLATVFKQFKTGQHGHMAFVRRINNEGDPFSETIGLITIEDVIEELIQAEIMDETDITDYQGTTKLKVQLEMKNATVAFAERREIQRIHISPQLKSAAIQYLSTCVNAFKLENISETILHRLLNQDVIFHIKCKGKDKNDPSLLIFEQGQPADYFVLILEGRVEVTAGQDKLTFECGPFTFFGSDALSQNICAAESNHDIRRSLHSLNMNSLLKHSFSPDYSVKATKDVFYLAIKRSLYLAAKRATLMERSQKIDDHGSNEPIDDDVKMFLKSLDEDYRNAALTANLNIMRSCTSPPKEISTDGTVVNNLAAQNQMMLPPHI